MCGVSCVFGVVYVFGIVCGVCVGVRFVFVVCLWGFVCCAVLCV